MLEVEGEWKRYNPWVAYNEFSESILEKEDPIEGF